MKIWTLALWLLCFSTSVIAQLRQENINGFITLDERNDTTQSRIHKTGRENVLIRSDKDFVYLGVHSDVLASVSIVLNKGDEFIVIHASGCAGRGIYKRVKGDSLQIVQAFYDVRTSPEKWDVVGSFANKVVFKKEKPMLQVRTEMSQCLDKWGYMTSMLDMGSYREVEILISKKVFKDYHVLVQNTEYISHQAPGTQKVFYPSGVAAPPATIQKFLEGAPGTALSISFKTDEWLHLNSL